MPRIADRPLGLYMHLPWCVQKCPYCDFNSHALRTDAPPEAEYTRALIADLKRESTLARTQGWRRPFTSVFIGGGTPSLFSAAAIGQMLDAAVDSFGVQEHAEVTLEANPGAVERTSFAGLRTAGVNRVSLGAQSFNDRALRALGRVHRSADTAEAIQLIRRGGIDNINLDIMYALPRQSTDEALADLATGLALAPTHLSHYQLTIEPNTLFHHDPPELPDDEAAFETLERSAAKLARAGFEQYEVSAYTTPGHASKHNLNYWRFGDYVGVGAGAHGKVTLPAGAVLRTTKPRHPKHYLETLGVAGAHWTPGWRDVRRLSADDLAFEYPLNALRRRDAVFDPAEFEDATGLSGDRLSAPLAAACDRGLLQRHRDGVYATTALGWRFLNDLQALFLPAQSTAPSALSSG